MEKTELNCTDLRGRGMISVIVPMHNAEKYITRCLDSIIKQSYTNIEILCVDDHSSDHTVELCLRMQMQDARIIIIENEGKGTSAARNTGLKASNGDFIGFVDADDWIEADMYELLMGCMKLNQVDLAVCAIWKDYLEYAQEVENEEDIDTVFDNYSFIRFILIRDKYRSVGGYPINKLYKRDTIVNNGVYFSEDLRQCEGVELMIRLALCINRIGFVSKPLYHYCQNEDSVSHSKNIEILKDALPAYQRIIDNLDNDQTAELTIWAKRFYVYHAANLCELAINSDCKMVSFFQNAIRRYYKEYVITNRNYPDRIQRVVKLLEQ